MCVSANEGQALPDDGKKGRTSEVRWEVWAGSCGSTEALDAGPDYQKGFV